QRSRRRPSHRRRARRAFAPGAGIFRGEHPLKIGTREKSLQSSPKPSSSPNQPEAHLEVERNYEKKLAASLPDPLSVCNIAPHARRPSAAEDSGRRGSRAFPHPANGRSEARERDPHTPCEPEARPQGGTHADPRPAAGSARVPADRQGLRSPARGPEVRAREGEPDPHAMPDLAEQDDR